MVWVIFITGQLHGAVLYPCRFVLVSLCTRVWVNDSVCQVRVGLASFPLRLDGVRSENGRPSCTLMYPACEGVITYDVCVLTRVRRKVGFVVLAPVLVIPEVCWLTGDRLQADKLPALSPYRLTCTHTQRSETKLELWHTHTHLNTNPTQNTHTYTNSINDSGNVSHTQRTWYTPMWGFSKPSPPPSGRCYRLRDQLNNPVLFLQNCL